MSMRSGGVGSSGRGEAMSICYCAVYDSCTQHTAELTAAKVQNRAELEKQGCLPLWLLAWRVVSQARLTLSRARES